MRLRSLAVAFALSALAVAPACVQRAQETQEKGGGEEATGPLQEKGGEDETGPYDVVPDWQKPLPTHDSEWGFGIVSGVFAESPDRIFVIVPGDLPKKVIPGAPRPAARRQNFVHVVNRNGEMIENWSQWDSLWKTPQYVTQSPYDPERRVWIADNGVHQIFVFSNDGKKLLMTLGEANKPGNDKTHLNGPADISFLPDGTFLVADGYNNTRVVKFDKNGQYLMEFGTKGSAPGQLDFVHSAAVGPGDLIYVGDRRNSRVQVFDQNGKFLDLWPGIREPVRVVPASDGSVWVADVTTSKLLKYDKNGYLLYSWGTGGTFPGAFDGLHSLSVDQEGNLYVGDFRNHRLLKFIPKKNADKSKLVPRPFGFPPIK